MRRSSVKTIALTPSPSPNLGRGDGYSATSPPSSPRIGRGRGLGDGEGQSQWANAKGCAIRPSHFIPLSKAEGRRCRAAAWASPVKTILHIVTGLVCLVVVGGCSSVWLTPTPARLDHASPTPTSLVRLRLQAPRGDKPTVVQATLEPPPTPRAELLTVEDVPVQFWSDLNDVTSLVYDGIHLWAGGGGGVVRWDPISGEYRVYTTHDGLQSQAVAAIAQDGDGHIWVSYVDVGSWSEFDGQAWHSYESREVAVISRYEAMLRAQRFDPRMWSSGAGSESIWLPHIDGHVMSYDGSKWRSYGQSEGVAPNARLVAVSDAGRVWAVGKGVSTRSETSGQWEHKTYIATAPDGSDMASIAVDKGGGLWLALIGSRHLGGGLSHLDAASDGWTGYRHALNPAIPRNVYWVEVDAEGVVWVCGDGGIAFRPPGEPWRGIAISDLTVQCFARDDKGRFWIGTGHGIWSVAADGSELRGPWLVPSPLVGNQVTQLALDDRGTLWVGTTRGLSSVDRHGKARLLMSAEVLSLAVDSTGRTWVGTRGGLYVVQSDGASQRMLDRGVVAIALDSSNAPWACTTDGDLVKLTDSGWQGKSTGDLVGSLPRDMVVNSDGTVWLATASGLGRWSSSGEFSLSLVEDGLPHLDIRALALGPDGALWIATAGGLARRLPSGKWTRFTTTSTEGGLRSMEMWDVSVDDEGTLWMATSAGISARTRDADWSFFDMPGARRVCPEPGGAVWVGSLGGLYRVKREALIAVP